MDWIEQVRKDRAERFAREEYVHRWKAEVDKNPGIWYAAPEEVVSMAGQGTAGQTWVLDPAAYELYRCHDDVLIVRRKTFPRDPDGFRPAHVVPLEEVR